MAAPFRSKSLFTLHPALRGLSFFPFRRNGSTESIISLLLKKQPNEEKICVKGWVKGVQGHQGVTFLHLTDGSGPQHLQVVIPHTLIKDPGVTFGSCIKATGTLTKSLGAGQAVELLTSNIEVVGPCDALEFPFKQRHRHPPQYARDFLHLRPKTNLFGALLRIRNSASMAIHEFFQKEGYAFIHTPILTSSDCEGACEMFNVEPPAYGGNLDDYDAQWEDGGTGPPPINQSGSDSKNGKEKPLHFFKKPAFLTVSGQLHLEAMASAMTKVYNFGPTFRAENSKGSFHLSEFYMVEAELAFTESLEDVLQVMESLVKRVYESVMERSARDVQLYSKYAAPPNYRKNVDAMMQSDFKRMSYTEAIDMLQRSTENFKFKVKWGHSLKKEHEMYLTKVVGNVPVFVTDYPAITKPFYSRRNEDSETVAASDLLLPGLGELCGSSLREERFDHLQRAVEKQGLADELSWYLDLRRFGSCPHGGFGLGFERLLMALLGAHSIRDVIPFPRWPGRCQA